MLGYILYISNSISEIVSLKSAIPSLNHCSPLD
jgi:hypothetical protein